MLNLFALALFCDRTVVFERGSETTVGRYSPQLQVAQREKLFQFRCMQLMREPHLAVKINFRSVVDHFAAAQLELGAAFGT